MNNPRTILSALLLTLTVGTGCAMHSGRMYAAQTVRIHYIERGIKQPTPPWARVDPHVLAEQARFVAEVEHRMDGLTARTRARVEHGELSPTALTELARERAYTDTVLSRYSSDGKITGDERNHVETCVAQMQALDARPTYRTTAIGGGPRSTR